MSATATYPKLNLSEALGTAVENYYTDIFGLLDELVAKTGENRPGNYSQIRYTVANYLWLIHERLNLGLIKDVDYGKIQNFATRNKDLITYLFKKQFPEYSAEALSTWIEPSIDILDCALYRPSNRYNKHIFH